MIPLGEQTALCPRCSASFSTRAEDTPVEQPAAPASDRSAGTVADAWQSDTTERDMADLQWLGMQFKDKYEILEFVGQGGMGAVYRARQSQPSREVALKVMLGGAFASGKHRRRFEREAQAVARLKHPAIVPVYEYGEATGQPYFTMEFVDGVDLRTHVAHNHLSREEICRLMVRICDAVHYAHQHGVVHRDIKPGNIMVDSLNRPRILDFGLSHASVEGDEDEPTLTVTGEFMGTPRYISPEQALGHRKDVDERTDLYALGVVLYELIVGVPPYPVEHARGPQLLEMLSQATALRPSSLHPTMPGDLEIILLKAVERDKEQRYQSAEAFAQDLESYLEGRPISARPATLGYRFRKWAWRNRKVLTPVVLLLVVIATLTGLFAYKLMGLGQRREELESDVSKFAEFRRRAEGAGAGVAELIGQGRWTEAKELAAFALRFFPEDAGVEELPEKVRQAAGDRVRSAIDAFADLVRAQDYSEARRKAKALTALAEAMPYEELQREAGDVEPGFEEFCWSDLLAAVDEAFAREETLARIQKFIELRADNPHLAEAEDMLAEMRPKPDDHFLQQHVRAFDRAVESYGWRQAERVLDSAQELLAVGKVQNVETWQEKLGERRRQIDSVIRAETAAKLDQLWPPRKHKGMVKCVEFTPDGGFLAVGGLDDMVTLYDTASGEIVRTFDHGQGVWCVAISSNGKLLAIGGSESDEKAPVTMWSVAEAQLLHRLEEHKKRVLSVDFSPGGDLLASADAQGVILWNVKKGKPVSVPGIQGGAPSAFSPDGRLLATGLSEKGVGLWDTSTGKSMGILETGQKPTRLAFSPDGTVVATAYIVTGRDRVWLWNMTQRAAIDKPTLDVRKAALALTFSPDGRILATGGWDRLIKLWDVRSGTLLQEFDGHKVAVSCAAFSPDGRFLATGGHDSTLRLWGIPAPDPSGPIGAPAREAQRGAPASAEQP